ncbi:MAG TPA: enoyl-CoA hydratase-related protein [Acidimicrobiales bacterium]|nr:enoyl-CoA hydratase-related protein [Acidimicrobiales bacterium]
MIQIDDQDRVRLVTLDRPDALNAMNGELYRATGDALNDAARDPGTSVVVITGNGRAFCAGQDIAELGQIAGDDGAAAGSGFPYLAAALTSFPKPLIAAVNGIAVGIGFTMLPHCDLVYVAESARFRTPFAALGVSPEAASSALFPMVMGWQAAAHTLLTGAWLSADEAVTAGFALAKVADDALLDTALAAARTMAALPLVSLVTTKRLMRTERDALVARATDAENAAFAELLGGPANQEAIAAFLDKREPDFSKVTDA